MVSNVALTPILTGGRIIDGIRGNYVRTKSADGFSRLYKLVDGKPVFLRASKTKVKDMGEGKKIIYRNKYTVGKGYQEIKGEFHETVRVINTFIQRAYLQNKREKASIKEFSYDFSKGCVNDIWTEDLCKEFKFPLDMAYEKGFSGGRFTELNKDYSGGMKLEKPVIDSDGTRIEGDIMQFSMYPSSIYGRPSGEFRDMGTIYLDSCHNQNRIHFKEYEEKL